MYENGQQISREYFSSSTYRATPDEVTIGTKEEETEQANNTQTNTTQQETAQGDGTLFGN